MIPLVVLVAPAFAGEPAPTCDVESADARPLHEPPESLSVVWVSRLRERARRQEWIPVVGTAALRAWVARDAPDGASPARLLQHLGIRGRAKAPRRRYKVTVFDVRSRDLCRPLAGYQDPAAVAGAVTCPRSRSEPSKRSAGCGSTLDRATGGPGEELYLVRWDDAARNGFCVLPVERFTSAGAAARDLLVAPSP